MAINDYRDIADLARMAVCLAGLLGMLVWQVVQYRRGK
jgi:hypothetical protein